MHRSRAALRAIGIAAVLALAGCSAAGPTADPDVGRSAIPTRAGQVPRPVHVVMVIFENHDAQAVLGATAAPYLTSLAEAGARLTNSHGVAHPSQPNYIALLSGSTHGIVDDSCPESVSAPNLATELRSAGKTFVGYSEDLPHRGFTGCSADGYARKHNPWVDFRNIPAAVNQPLSALPHDYAALPTVSIIVPNLCHDMHDCSIATGDRWARRHLSGYVRWARTHNSLLIVTFDEDDGTPANHIPTLIVGPMVRHAVSAQPVDHYNILRTVEDMYGVAPLGRSRRARPFTAIWTAASLVRVRPTHPRPTRHK
jgi:acid phosphatase